MAGVGVRDGARRPRWRRRRPPAPAAPAASSASRLPARRPPTVARTSARAWRAVAWMDSSSALARAGSMSTSRAASSAFTERAVSEWPSTSCTSRATRSRSATMACWLLRLVGDLLALAEDPEHDAADHDRPEHQEEVGREAVDAPSSESSGVIAQKPTAHFQAGAGSRERGEHGEVGRVGDHADADHRHGAPAASTDHARRGTASPAPTGVADDVGHGEAEDAGRLSDLRGRRDVGLGDRDDRVDEEDQPDGREGPTPLLPGVGGELHGRHVRSRLRRTPQSASREKITVHASTLATGSHRGSCPPIGSQPSVSGKRASAA